LRSIAADGDCGTRTLDRLAVARHDPFDPALARPDPWQSRRLALAALRRRF
jgi:hypothetical protein